MKQSERNLKQTRSLRGHAGALAAALLFLGLLLAPPAFASYEQVDTFAGTPGVLQLQFGAERSTRWPEEVQLGAVGGMAVNYTGAGGVPKGTLYAATYVTGEDMRIARYNPDGSFSESWTFKGTLGGAPEERCGPEGDPGHPVCARNPEDSVRPTDVDIDQSTGYVYAIRANGLAAGTNLIHAYTPDGSKLFAEFGEQAASPVIAESPGKIHSANSGSLAVDSEGHVYVYDVQQQGLFGFSSRLMEFEPQSSGDYEHYVYAGQSHDIESKGAMQAPVADAAGDLYVTSGATTVVKLDPSQPADPPLCEFEFPPGQIISLTVDPLSGEVFFRSQTDKKIHVLEPCDKEGKFVETGKFSVSPQRTQISALAFDPLREFAPGRPPGVLYAGAPGGDGGKTEGEPPNTKGESSMGYVFAHPVELPPEVLMESVAHVTATTAELGAQINPKGQPTRYTFQYLTQAEYEANEPSERFAGGKESPPGGALLGEGPVALSAATSLSGLSPDTTYHYRAVATSHCSEEHPEKACEGVGVDQSFGTFPREAPGLPDHRAYELVSPVQKEGGVVYPADPSVSSSCVNGLCKPGGIGGAFPRQSSPDGEAIVYEGTAFSGEEGAVGENQYIARRNPKIGWQTTNPTPAQLIGREGGYKAFDTELTQGVIEQSDPVLSAEAPPAGYLDLYSQPIGNPLALSTLLTEAPPNRVPASAGTFNLKYAGASADLSHVFFAANDALTHVTAFAPEAEDGGSKKNNLYEWEPATGQMRLVNVSPENTEAKAGASFGAASAQAISKDGSRAFWSDESGQVYVRIDGETTKEIETEGTPDPGKFLAASSDGSRVLLANGHLHGLGDEEPTVDLTEGKGGFLGIAGQSDDLSHVYFVDTAVLNEEENEQHAKAQAGQFNLYAWQEGGTTRFVATLVAQDNSNGVSGSIDQASDWQVPSLRSAEASPQGRYLAFASVAPLTGQESIGNCKIVVNFPPAIGSGPCKEAFLYDSATGKLSCASCNPTGLAPLGPSVLRRIFHATPAMPQPRYLTDQGRLYFDSRDSLSPFDTNEGVEDVYQYEPSGVGTCKRSAGCVSLISAGSEPSDSNLLAVDESGKNVFFTTRDQLVLKDRDDLIDLYDAREDGGIPGETEVARGECQGEACVPALSPPNDPTPGSSSFEGAGNVDERKPSKKHAKKHKKKHAKKKAHKRAAKHNRGGAK